MKPIPLGKSLKIHVRLGQDAWSFRNHYKQVRAYPVELPRFGSFYVHRSCGNGPDGELFTGWSLTHAGTLVCAAENIAGTKEEAPVLGLQFLRGKGLRRFKQRVAYFEKMLQEKENA